MNRIALGFLLSVLSFSALSDNKESIEVVLGKVKKIVDIGGYYEAKDTSKGIRWGYLFKRDLWVEIAYFNFGGDKYSGQVEYKYYRTEDSTAAITFGFKRVFPISSSVSIVGRLGWLSSYYKIKIMSDEYPQNSETLKHDDYGLYYGLGGEYKINDEITFGLEYTRIKTGIAIGYEFSDYEINNLALSVAYRF